MALKLVKREGGTYATEPDEHGVQWWTFKGAWGWSVGDRAADGAERTVPIYLPTLREAQPVITAGIEHGFDAVCGVLDEHVSRGVRYQRGRQAYGRQSPLYAGMAECSCGWSVRNLPSVVDARRRAVEHRVDALFLL
jgi:hypothetical protein